MPCSGASSATSFELLVRRDQVDVGPSRPVDPGLIGDQRDAFAAQSGGNVGEEGLDSRHDGRGAEWRDLGSAPGGRHRRLRVAAQHDDGSGQRVLSMDAVYSSVR